MPRTHPCLPIQPALTEFITACHDHGVLVALSSWYRQDATDARMLLTTSGAQAHAWISVHDALADAGLTGQILYVDLGNEFPLSMY